MKYQKYLLLICLLVSPSVLTAQFSLGAKGGFTKAWEEYGDVGLPEDAEIHINGFNASAMIYYRFNDFLSFGVEPGFVQKGAACEPGFDGFTGTAELHLNYFEMPIVLASNFGLFGDRIQLLGKAGFDNSITTDAYRMQGIGTREEFRTDLEIGGDNVSRFDPSVQGAIGIGYKLGSNLLFTETQYDFGFRDVVSTARSENRSLNVAFGFLVEI